MQCLEGIHVNAKKMCYQKRFRTINARLDSTFISDISFSLHWNVKVAASVEK